ncbi:MAG: trypsin-like peptidase domain-containing protein [Pirellulaceae bacterium]|nr:trypsin-like peptidase domain-containing protein [Planctomycetales bacterium]
MMHSFGKVIRKATFTSTIATVLVAASQVLGQSLATDGANASEGAGLQAEVEDVGANSAAVAQAKSLSQAFRQASSRVAPAVVTIVSRSRDPNLVEKLLLHPRFFEFFPDGVIPSPMLPGVNLPDGVESPDVELGVGSGIIVRRDGLVLTNNHVVDSVDSMVVRLADGREFPVDRVKADVKSDVAIVRIQDPPANLPTAHLGDSDALEIGDWVIAIGSPFELETTVSAGIISGKGRSIDKIERGKLLQTDAAINPGNSGGPLVNLDGQVIGLNTAIASSSGGYQGIGFAIPINDARWIAEQLLHYGVVRRGYLGVNIADIKPPYAESHNLPVRFGAIITKVAPSQPADDAGLEGGDVIVEFAGQQVRDSRDLQMLVERQRANSEHTIKVIRNGKINTLQVRLGEDPQR